MSRLLDHAAVGVRLLALRISLDIARTTDPLPRATALPLKTFIPLFHQEVDPKSRARFVTLMGRFIMKFKDLRTRWLLHRDSDQECTQEGEAPTENASAESDFRNWYFRFLVQELRPTGTYQGHVTALAMLKKLEEAQMVPDGLRSLALASSSDIASYERLYACLIRGLIDLLFDPFDDVRGQASALLHPLLISELGLQDFRDSHGSSKSCSSRPPSVITQVRGM